MPRVIVTIRSVASSKEGSALSPVRRRSPIIAAAGIGVGVLLLTLTQTASAAPGGRHQPDPVKPAERGIYLYCTETPGRSPGYYCRQIASLPPGMVVTPPVTTTTTPTIVTKEPTVVTPSTTRPVATTAPTTHRGVVTRTAPADQAVE